MSDSRFYKSARAIAMAGFLGGVTLSLRSVFEKGEAKEQKIAILKELSDKDGAAERINYEELGDIYFRAGRDIDYARTEKLLRKLTDEQMSRAIESYRNQENNKLKIKKN